MGYQPQELSSTGVAVIKPCRRIFPQTRLSHHFDVLLSVYDSTVISMFWAERFVNFDKNKVSRRACLVAVERDLGTND